MPYMASKDKKIKTNGPQSPKKRRVLLLYAAYMKKHRTMNSGPGSTLYTRQKTHNIAA